MTSRRRPTSRSRAPLSNIQARANADSRLRFPDDTSVSSKVSSDSELGPSTRVTRSSKFNNSGNSNRSSTSRSSRHHRRQNLNSSPTSTSSKGSASSNRFKLRSSTNDTRPIHDAANEAPALASNSKMIAPPPPPSSMQSKRRIRNTKTSSAIAAESTLPNSSDLKAGQRLEWAKQRGASAEGDIMRLPSSFREQQQQQQQRRHKKIQSVRQQQQQPSATMKNDHNGEQVVTMTESQIQELIQNRIQHSQNETIISLKKQLDDLKFFQELEKQQQEELEQEKKQQREEQERQKLEQQNMNDNNIISSSTSVSIVGPSSPGIVPIQSPEQQYQIQQLKAQLRAAQHTIQTLNTENLTLNNSVSQLRENNIDLQAKLQVSSPNHNNLSSPEAYKKALRLQSDLLDARNLLQEETSRREEVQNNINQMMIQHKNEVEGLMEQIEQSEKALEERNNDLDDGVLIVKGLEEELELMGEKLAKEEHRAKKMEKLLEKFENDKKAIEENVSLKLNNSRVHVDNMRSKFEKEKKDLEAKCHDCELEVQEMKVRVKEMETKRGIYIAKAKEFEEMDAKIEAIREEHEKEKKQIEVENQERIVAYQQSLDGKVAEAKGLKEKIIAMEQIVSMYHEKARSEVKEYVHQVDEARLQEAEAREELHEALKQIQEHEDINEMLESDIDEIKNDLSRKEKELTEALENVEKLSGGAKNQNALKAKDHQHMREKKKWMTIEKNLRQELKDVQQKKYNVETEHELILGEHKQLSDLVEEMEVENMTLRNEIKSLGKESDEDKYRLQKFEEESRRRVQSLEQEIYRLQRISPIKEKLEMRYHNGNVFIQEENIIGKFDPLHSSRDNSDNRDNASRLSTRRKKLVPPDQSPERKDEITSPRQISWEDKEESSPSSSKKSKERERQTIENDAIRKYMRKRRTAR